MKKWKSIIEEIRWNLVQSIPIIFIAVLIVAAVGISTYDTYARSTTVGAKYTTELVTETTGCKVYVLKKNGYIEHYFSDCNYIE